MATYEGDFSLKYQETLNTIYARLDRLGDLPVFSATVNQIRQISSASDTDAMSLALAIMKDPNLTTKLLRLANSSQYNRTGGKVTAISRAVVLIGFERIRNLCMTLKLIESFEDKDPETGIENLLVAAVLNAATARDLAISAGVEDVEETYICGLLFSLGEIVVAYTLPEIYKEMLTLRRMRKLSWMSIQQQALGGEFVSIGRDLIQSWGFSKRVVSSIRLGEPPEGLSRQELLNQQIVSGCHQLFEQIYQRSPQLTGEEYTEQLVSLAELTRLPPEKLEETVNHSVRQLCDHIEQYGLSHKSLIPPVSASGNETLDEMTRKVAFYIHARQEQKRHHQKQDDIFVAEQHKRLSEYNRQQLIYLEKMSDLMTGHAPTTEILTTCVEGIEASSSLERVVFCLSMEGGKKLDAKLLEGNQLDTLMTYFQLKRDVPHQRLFFHILDRGSSLLVHDSRDPGWFGRLPKEFLDSVMPSGFIIAPLTVDGKTIGLFYADKTQASGPVEDRDFKVFNQFIIQCRIALEMGKKSTSQSTHKS